MKLTIAQADLLPVVSQAVSVAPKRGTVPVLSHLRLKAEDGLLTIEANDLRQDYMVRLAADVREPGEILVPAHQFEAAVKAHKQADIAISAAATRCTLTHERARFSTPVLPAADWPALGAHDGVAFTVNPEIWGRFVRMVATAAEKNGARYYLCGVHLSPQGLLVATDGHRCIEVALGTGPIEGLPDNVIIPTEAVQLLTPDFGGDLQVVVNGRRISVTAGDATMRSQLIDGTFPDYRRVIPDARDVVLRVNRAALAAAVSQIESFATSQLAPDGALARRTASIGFEMDAAAGTLTLYSGDVDDTQIVLDAEIEGDACTVGFNAAYVRAMLSALRCERIEIVGSGAGAAWRFLAPDTEDFTGVIMPMRVTVRGGS